MSALAEIRKLAKMLGILIGLPCGLSLGTKMDLAMNKLLGDPSGRSMFPFPIFLLPVTVIVVVVFYCVLGVLAERHISTNNSKMLGTLLVMINAGLIVGTIAWVFTHPF